MRKLIGAFILICLCIFIDVYSMFFGKFLNYIFPCYQNPLYSFPCYGKYDIWFMLVLLFIGLIILIKIGIKIFKTKDQ